MGIDLDHCLDSEGKPNEIADSILTKLPQTYVEISPSGAGLHIFLFGKLPSGGNKNSKLGVEMYCKSRYFTVTGNAYVGSVPQIGMDNGAIDFVYSKYIAVGKTKKHKVSSHPGRPLSDDELLDLANNSRDGAAFKALWEGSWSSNFPSQSEADFALCRKLAFWSGRNATQIDRLFRKSGLYREKWDKPHHSSGETYGEHTISRACEITENCYTPPPKNENPEFSNMAVFIIATEIRKFIR